MSVSLEQIRLESLLLLASKRARRRCNGVSFFSRIRFLITSSALDTKGADGIETALNLGEVLLLVFGAVDHRLQLLL
jgi:hypothetical protein